MEEEKLNWMYKGVSGLVDREAYLTGRKIDKTFELALREERGERIDAPAIDSVPASFLDPSTSVSSNKLLDDPLIEIKKRQLEEARKILNNPYKMKKIKEMIEAQASKESNKSSVKKKKKKKSSKKKHKHSRDYSSDDDERRRKHKKSRRHKHRSKSRSRSKSPSDRRKSKSRHRS